MFDINPMGSDGDNSAETVWKDYPFIMFLLTAALLSIVLLLVNEPTEDAESDIEAPGGVLVEVIWDNQRDVDVDLWVLAPGDVPVGYSNMSGKIFNLVRDDRGFMNDLSDLNLENANSRGTPAGEYCVNLHYFHDYDRGGPVECTVIVRSKETAGAPLENVVSTKFMLKPEGHEETVFRFKLTDKGKLVPGSIHHIQKPLRSAHLGG
jgi:hypothetical protein